MFFFICSLSFGCCFVIFNMFLPLIFSSRNEKIYNAPTKHQQSKGGREMPPLPHPPIMPCRSFVHSVHLKLCWYMRNPTNCITVPTKFANNVRFCHQNEFFFSLAPLAQIHLSFRLCNGNSLSFTLPRSGTFIKTIQNSIMYAERRIFRQYQWKQE